MQYLIKTSAMIILICGVLTSQAQFVSSKDKSKKETTTVNRDKDLSAYSQTLVLLKKEYRLNQRTNGVKYLKQLTDIMHREVIRTENDLSQTKPGNESRTELINRLKDEKRIEQSVLNFDAAKSNTKALLYLQKLLDQFEWHMKQAVASTQTNTGSPEIPKDDGASSILYGGETHISASGTVVKGQRNDKTTKGKNTTTPLSRMEIASQLSKLSTGIAKAYRIGDEKRAMEMHQSLIQKMEAVISVNQKQLQEMRKEGKDATDKEFKILSFKTQNLVGSKKAAKLVSLPSQLKQLDDEVNRFNHYIR